MSEPTTFADRVETLREDLRHWSLFDDRIQFRSDAYALRGESGWVLVDPLPLAAEASKSLETVEAIVLTAGHHQRSAWSLRRRWRVPVHAPEGAAELEEAADLYYRHGDRLPGRLRAMEAPGAGKAHYLLLREGAGPVVVFCGDLVVRREDGSLHLLDPAYRTAKQGFLKSVQRLIELAPQVLCPAHGAPETKPAAELLRELLRREG